MSAIQIASEFVDGLGDMEVMTLFQLLTANNPSTIPDHNILEMRQLIFCELVSRAESEAPKPPTRRWKTNQEIFDDFKLGRFERVEFINSTGDAWVKTHCGKYLYKHSKLPCDMSGYSVKYLTVED